MGFWKLMSELIDGYTVQLTIRKSENKIIVLLVPKLDVKKDEVQREIVPLTISGTPDELDQGFFMAIAEGLQKTSGLQSNIKDYEASLKKADTKAAPKSGAKGIAAPKKPDLFDKKKDEKAKTEEKVPVNVDEETGEIKEEPKTEPVKQGNSVKMAKSEKKAEEKPVVQAESVKDKPPFDSDPIEGSNDDFGDENW